MSDKNTETQNQEETGSFWNWKTITGAAVVVAAVGYGTYHFFRKEVTEV